MNAICGERLRPSRGPLYFRLGASMTFFRARDGRADRRSRRGAGRRGSASSRAGCPGLRSAGGTTSRAEVQQGVLGALPDAPVGVGHGLEQEQHGISCRGKRPAGRPTGSARRGTVSLRPLRAASRTAGWPAPMARRTRTASARMKSARSLRTTLDEDLDGLRAAQLAERPDRLEADVVRVVLEGRDDPRGRATASPTSARTLIAQQRPQAAQPICAQGGRGRFLDVGQAFVDELLEQSRRPDGPPARRWP